MPTLENDKKEKKGKPGGNGKSKPKTIHNRCFHGTLPISEGASKLVATRSGPSIKLVSKQLSRRRAKSKKVSVGRCNTNSQAIRGAARMAGLGRNRSAFGRNESRAKKSFGDAGALFSLTATNLTSQELLRLLFQNLNHLDWMRGDWVTTWLFQDVKNKAHMSDVVTARFASEKLSSVLKPHSRSVIYSEHTQSYGTRSIWKDQNLLEIILAASLTDQRKTCVYIGQYDSWYHHDRMYQKALEAWDADGTMGSDPEMVELLKRHVGFYRREPPLLRII